MEEIIYFELNHWWAGSTYPDDEPFISWMSDYYKTPEEESKSWIRDKEIMDKWYKDNELVVVISVLDMSVNFCVSAKKSWVEKVCPKLLTEYTKFLRTSEDGNLPIGEYSCPFKEYKPENFGIHYWSYEEE